MQKKETSKGTDLISCQYQISVLRDNFVPMILEALGKVNTDKVRAKTGKTGTIYRGKAIHVVDCVKACFSHIFDDSYPYITMTATFFKNKSDLMRTDCCIAEDEILLNDTNKSFYVLGRMSLFPLGIEDYVKHQKAMESLAKKRNIAVTRGYCATDFAGDVRDMFAFLNDVLAYGNERLDDYALNVSMTIYGAEAVK